ncbi:hypothetical protein A1D29_01810 [Pasteurellaceae bacterium Orientalotternb1]|nr:hypothetical protein A1D29_01810 [Pasteurellaceae bacterium Orientalotternb1]
MKNPIDPITERVNPKISDNRTDLQCHWEQFYNKEQQLILDLRSPNRMENPHWHSHIEVNIVFEGEVEYEINNQKYSLVAGDVGIFLALIPHQVVHTTSQKLGLIYFPVTQLFNWENKDLLRQILSGELIKVAQNIPLHKEKFIEWQNDYQNNITRLQDIASQEIKLFLQRLLVQYKLKKTHSTHQKSLDHIITVLLYISQHFDTCITVTHLAELTGTNKNYLSTLFKQTLGMSIKQYIINLRLSYAITLIKEGELSITDIIFLSGFHSKNSFYNAFNKAFNISPSEIKRRHC